MHYIVYCQDKPNHVEKRLANYDAHKAYLMGNPIKFLMSGPIVDEEDRETMLGSFFLVEADNISEVEDFNKNDPFYAAGIWESIHIKPFHKRVDNISAK
ncbi:YciI family protein [Sedimenticola selenatireducens]|uniref:YCII-related domain-containing protein n=1 Tax=Sedimenticola selenatireducens TaxID=191960 RepID=A0A2N6CWD9_9GAMM|nr:YciI family protein [Sedimenticola selenatireducens]PLX61582.1 MAG: hypothetical protein C0630_10495 [Sedimenticola selenatireducens]